MNEQSIADIVKENPSAAKVFDKYGIDYCCGGKVKFSEVCNRKNLNEDSLLREIHEYVEIKNGTTFQEMNQWPADLICDYLEKTHHRYLKEFFSTLEPKINKLVLRHGENHPELKEIHALMENAREELILHLKKEELILFPSIRKYVQAKLMNEGLESAPFGSIENPIHVMESEHEHEGERLEILKQLTNHFSPPEDACQTYRSVFQMLKEFSDDMHKHVYTENHILFPKAVSLEKFLNEQNHVF